MLKSLLCTATLLFAAISLASATGINIDTAHHHLGDDFKKGLTPSEPESLVYTATINLDSPTDIRSAELTLTAKSVVSGPTDEFLDKVYLNDKEIGTLNDYIPAQTLEEDAINIAIPIHPSILKHGTYTIKITSGSNADGSNYDDFEFYNLAMHLTETEPVTLEPPLKVAWTYELSRPLFSSPSVSLIAENVVYLENEISIKAIDANTGELLWNTEGGADLAYEEGALFAVRYANIDALDAKTGTLLWRKEYVTSDGNGPSRPIGVPGGNPVIFGDTLFVSSDKYISAIDTTNGNLEWRYELNLTDFGTGGRNYYSISSPAVSEDIVVFQFSASHSSYTGPPVAIEPGAPEPELGETIKKEGLIALDTNTGEEVWQYAYTFIVDFFPESKLSLRLKDAF
ncbi:MAG: PQQ-like beta-propeller repeat protein [Proteobacteria bacterium]|nr:PQQ-like beta-propeller repeat protein [Pseudomonadota bacterium]